MYETDLLASVYVPLLPINQSLINDIVVLLYLRLILLMHLFSFLLFISRKLQLSSVFIILFLCPVPNLVQSRGVSPRRRHCGAGVNVTKLGPLTYTM